MTEKQKVSFEKIIGAIPVNSREAYREVAEYIMSLGYNPRLNGGETYADFIKSKHRKTIMKIETGKTPRLAIRFDALPVCSGIFKEAVEKRKMSYCPKCKYKCNGNNGISKKYVLPDGRECYICNVVIDIPAFNAENVSKIKEVLKIQDEHLMSLIPKK
jgi:hypothetical protein